MQMRGKGGVKPNTRKVTRCRKKEKSVLPKPKKKKKSWEREELMEGRGELHRNDSLAGKRKKSVVPKR